MIRLVRGIPAVAYPIRDVRDAPWMLSRAVRRRLIDKMWTVTIPARLVPLGRAMAITGLGLLLAPLVRLHAQAATPALPPASPNQPAQSTPPAQTTAPSSTPANPATGSQSQSGLLPRDEPP